MRKLIAVVLVAIMLPAILVAATNQGPVKPTSNQVRLKKTGCTHLHTRKAFKVVARKVYHGDWKITRHENNVLHHVIVCQHTAKAERIVRHWLKGYKRAHYRRWYWTIEWSKVDPGLKATLARVKFCESSGDYHQNTGGHTGAYQYDTLTWHEAGGSGQAWDASPREQDVRTARFFPSHQGRWTASVHCWG